jgi:Arc/MetJ-type ribon-helix-helix transcriptional regulator
MTTLSVPLGAELMDFIEGMVKDGNAANKVDVVRKALKRMRDEEAVNAILQSQKEMREGKIFRGDLRRIAKKFHD